MSDRVRTNNGPRDGGARDALCALRQRVGALQKIDIHCASNSEVERKQLIGGPDSKRRPSI